MFTICSSYVNTVIRSPCQIVQWNQTSSLRAPGQFTMAGPTPGWLVALVMCAMLPFMGVGAAVMGKAGSGCVMGRSATPGIHYEAVHEGEIIPWNGQFWWFLPRSLTLDGDILRNHRIGMVRIGKGIIPTWSVAAQRSMALFQLCSTLVNHCNSASHYIIRSRNHGEYREIILRWR